MIRFFEILIGLRPLRGDLLHLADVDRQHQPQLTPHYRGQDPTT